MFVMIFMKKYFFYLLFLLSFLLSGINLYENFIKTPINSKIERSEEEFDAKLYGLNTLSKVISYVDKQYGSSEIKSTDSLLYANLMARTLRLRFYHGWSRYGFRDNWVLFLMRPIHKHALGIVDPNDILNYPQALCSQQAIVGMEALKKRGYQYRKVGFYDSQYENGHFTYEILLKDGWHYYDLDMEPNLHIMESNNRPSIDSLATNDSLRRAAYSNATTEIKDHLIPKYNNNHPINVFPATNMLLFHRITMFLSYTLWLWIGIYLWRTTKKPKKNS
jgi:hypothetical protein